MNKDATPANGGSMEWLGVLSGSQPHRFGVWIEGGGRVGRWMSDFDDGREVWIGSVEEAASDPTLTVPRHIASVLAREGPVSR